MPDDSDYDPEELEEQYREFREREFSRPRGFLTGTDRQFLWGEKTYKHQQTEVDRRKKIRDRAVNGILDLPYLLRLEDQDRDRVTADLEELGTETLLDAASYLVQFVYLAESSDTEAIARLVERGIYNAEEGESGQGDVGVMNVTTEIDVDRGYNSAEIYKRFQAGGGEDLTPAEIGVLAREGLLDADDLDTIQTAPHGDRRRELLARWYTGVDEE